MVPLLTQADVVGKELGESITFLFTVAAAAAVTEGRHADFGGAQVVWCHHCTCEGKLYNLNSVILATSFLKQLGLMLYQALGLKEKVLPKCLQQ